MLVFVIFLFLLAILFFLSKKTIKNLYRFFYLLTGNKKTVLYLLSLILLPGTVIHEVSHMLVAELLFVKTGEFSFIPEVKEETIKIGSLQIAKSDPIRRTIVGLAPLIVGLTIITSVCYFYLFPPIINPLIHLWADIKSTIWANHASPLQISINFSFSQLLFLFSTLYLLSSISLTMFSSKKDLEQAVFPILLIITILSIFWLAGFKLTFPKYFLDFFGNIFTIINKSLVFVCFLDLIGFLGIRLIVKIAGYRAPNP